jgi:hypothetical protein
MVGTGTDPDSHHADAVRRGKTPPALSPCHPLPFHPPQEEAAMTHDTTLPDRDEIKILMERLYGDMSGYRYDEVPAEQDDRPEPDVQPEAEGSAETPNLADLIAVVRQLKQSLQGLPQEPDKVYGELSTDSLFDVMDRIPGGLSGNDVFVDLGSGLGKVCVQVFLATAVGACVGIELSARRHTLAGQVRDRLRTERPQLFAGRRSLHFVNEDILHADFGDATVIFLCARLFSDELMEKIASKIRAECPRLRQILSTKAVPGFDVTSSLTVHSAYAPQGEELLFYSA